jgi:hypothetical protein
MDFFSDQQRVSAPRWTEVVDDGAMPDTPISPDAELILLRQRVKELEATVADYEALLADLPDLFERKFQQRLEPLLERYRLLAHAQELQNASQPQRRHALRWSWPGVRRLGGSSGSREQDAA